MAPFLSIETLPRIPGPLRPALAPEALTVGLVHLGIGGFHRAHQAVYTEKAAEMSGDDRWGICGVSQRSATAADTLASQDGLYSVLCLAETGDCVRVMGSLRRTLFAKRDHEAVTSLLAQQAVTVVTLTVTEKGYRYDPGSRRLRADDLELVADAEGRAPATVLGQLARGLERRRRAGAGPLSILSCDNISGNGALLQELLREFLALPSARFDAGLAEWTEANARFPSTMVDRIVPATTEQWRREVFEHLGLTDRCPVAAEPFKQWVIEDNFASYRPAWELAGAEIVREVAPYETLKLRTLNGAHSALAYLGLLAGKPTISDALRQPGFESFVRKMLDEEVQPTLRLPPGTSFVDYRDSVLARFANHRLPYSCSQVATDGSHKLPQRILGTVRDLLATGRVPHLEVTVLAAWLRCIALGADDAGRQLELTDPLATEIREAMGPLTDARRAAEGALSLEQVFGSDLPDDQRFRTVLSDSLAALSRDGVQSVVLQLASQS